MSKLKAKRFHDKLRRKENEAWYAEYKAYWSEYSKKKRNGPEAVEYRKHQAINSKNYRLSKREKQGLLS